MSQPLDGERSVSDVANGKKRWFTPARKAGAIAIGAAVAVGFIVWKDPGHKKEDPEPPPPPTGISQSVSYDPPKPQPMPAAYQPMPPPASVQPPPPPAADRLPLALPLTNPAPQAVPQPRKPKMLSYATEAGAGGEHPRTVAAGVVQAVLQTRHKAAERTLPTRAPRSSAARLARPWTATYC